MFLLRPSTVTVCLIESNQVFRDSELVTLKGGAGEREEVLPAVIGAEEKSNRARKIGDELEARPK